jgi:DNA repair exonuclease SbcCD nuclease subunit
MTAPRILHASDLHLDETGESAEALARTVQAANELDVDLVLLVGDTFDTNRTAEPTLALFVGLVSQVRAPVIVLPGNHDPCVDDSVYSRMELPAHVTVLRDADGESVELPRLGIDLWGRPHSSYSDYQPLGGLPRRGRQPFQVALAHGHLVQFPEDRHRSYLITSEEIAASERDYIALGHRRAGRRVTVTPVRLPVAPRSAAP